MKNENVEKYSIINERRFPIVIFVTFLGVLLLMSGVHTWVIVIMNKVQLNGTLRTIIPMVYWALVACGLTLFTRKQIRTVYEEPVYRLAKATKQVADGDFSVYVPTIHTSDKWDYLDVMIVDFNKMVEELGSIETLKTDFVSNVSHEMKTPISVIKNYAELLRADNITEEKRKKYAKNIEEAALKLSNLISNILKLNKLENQKIFPKTESYDVCRQLCDCVIQFEDRWEAKEIEIEMDIEDSALIQADEQFMELVWNNLLSNAIKFTEPGGTITIQQTSDEKQISISVTDSGCGMSDECVKHIFDKFYQGDTSHSTEGNGLGLALVYRILQLLDGDIQVESKLGKGSTFKVLLPASMNLSDRNNGGLYE